MKTVSIAAATLVLMSGAAFAAPYHAQRGHVTSYERAAIARSQANLNALKRQAWADGKITVFERFKLRNAEARHRQLLAKAYRS